MARIELIPSPYRLADGKWIPRVTKRVHIGDKILEKKIEGWPEKFDTKDMALAFISAEIEVIKINN